MEQSIDQARHPQGQRALHVNRDNQSSNPIERKHNVNLDCFCLQIVAMYAQEVSRLISSESRADHVSGS